MKGDDSVRGNDGNDFLDGGAGDDLPYGDAWCGYPLWWEGLDRLYGGVGNDILDGAQVTIN